MDQAQAPAAIAASERLTWLEIRARYANEWVALVDVEWGDGENFDPEVGRVIGHSTDRKTLAPLIKLAFLTYDSITTLHTGESLYVGSDFEITYG